MKAALQRTTIWTLSVLLAGVMICYAVLPWDDEGHFKAGYAYRGTDSNFPTLTGSFIDYFETKYGTFPQFMIWEDTDLPARMNFSIHFARPRKAPTPPWGDVLRYEQVRTHLYWKIESVSTGSISYTPLELGIPDTTNLVWKYGWTTDNVLLDLRDLPIPNDGSAYIFQPIVFEDEPIPGKEILTVEDPWTIIRAKRETAYDSLAWAYFGEQLDWNKDVATALLRSFPTSRAILQRLFESYAADGNCDSLKWVARQYKDAIVPYADSMAVPLEGFENLYVAGGSSLPLNDYINEKLMSVCGDTLLGE